MRIIKFFFFRILRVDFLQGKYFRDNDNDNDCYLRSASSE